MACIPADADSASFEEITDIEFHVYYKIDGQRTHLDPLAAQVPKAVRASTAPAERQPQPTVLRISTGV